jgi:hypothetical protein
MSEAQVAATWGGNREYVHLAPCGVMLHNITNISS